MDEEKIKDNILEPKEFFEKYFRAKRYASKGLVYTIDILLVLERYLEENNYKIIDGGVTVEEVKEE